MEIVNGLKILKILFILHLPPPVHGASMMGKYLHDSKLINETFECKYINLTTAKSLQDIGKNSINKLWTFIRLLTKIIKNTITFKPQLVYVTPNACGGAFYKDFIVVQLLKLFRHKVITHYHNKGVSTRQDHWLDNLLYKYFFKEIKVILLSKNLYKDVCKYVDFKDVFICPNGIPETLMKEMPTERHNNEIHLLFLSNLLISKGILLLLDACKILKEKGFSFTCDFIGGETTEIDAWSFNENVRKRGLDKIASYRGKKYGKNKSQFFKNADIFVFPTSYPNECFPLVLLEAMEYSLPCISTNEGGIANIIEDGKTGYIIPQNDATALAEKIEYLILHHEERNAMGERGREKFKREFVLERFEKRMKDIINNAINRP